MGTVTTDSRPVRLTADALHIQDRAEIIMCASLFYFRIPRGHWRERMQQLKDFGYNCIDVYFPWNYHEQKEGVWDFTGERDIAAFLQTAAEVGLWVVARPGPYICSEWDGGGLPAYLNTVEGMRLRDNNPEFLAAVKRWFDQVLPILRSYQLGESGTVICVQLDNELDFYGCTDPLGYISALRDMALEHGITVPLIACAGQGGLFEASGLADDVVPTCNFYPYDRDPHFEEKVLSYQQLLQSMGLPLLVTETNRSHYLLRRLLACGVKLLGPYLQVSGTDFGFTNGTNNWGKPLAFLTSDYDFGGMISPEGHIRPEAYEGRLLSRIIAAYGSSIAEARPAAPPKLRASAEPARAIPGPYALQLRDGGHLVFVTNVSDEEADVTLEMGDDQKSQTGRFSLKPWRSLILPLAIPLEIWGLPGTLEYATAELFLHRTDGAETTLMFHAEGEGEISLKLGTCHVLETHNLTIERHHEGIRLTFELTESDAVGVCKLRLADDRILELVAMNRSRALQFEEVGADGELIFAPPFEYSQTPSDLFIDWSLSKLPMAEAPRESRVIQAERIDHLESYGIYRGIAWYETQLAAAPSKPVRGVLLQQASDIISLYAGQQYVSTVVPGGASCYIPFEPEQRDEQLTARVEIWGHSNFDDIRLPGLRLSAKKGLQGLIAVHNIIRLGPNWKVKPVKDRMIDEAYIGTAVDDRLWPIVGFGGWLTSDAPSFAYFRNSFEASSDADSWAIQFEGFQASGRLFVDGHDAGVINPADPTLDITPYVRPGSRVQLTVFVERWPNLSTGRARIYEGTAATAARIADCQEDQLWASAMSAGDRQHTQLPLTMEAGEMAWLLGEVRDSNEGRGWRVRVSGSNLKLTAFLNQHIVGRLWLPGSEARPPFTGGHQESIYLPGAWFEGDSGQVAILLEAFAGEDAAKLDGLSFIPV